MKIIKELLNDMSNTKENLKKRIFNISCQIIIIISLICALFYWLPSLDYRIAIAIHSNPVTKAISDIYDNIFLSFFSFLISVFSFIYAAIILCKRYRKSTADKKYIIFVSISLIASIIHFIILRELFYGYIYATWWASKKRHQGTWRERNQGSRC